MADVAFLGLAASAAAVASAVFPESLGFKGGGDRGLGGGWGDVRLRLRLHAGSALSYPY